MNLFTSLVRNVGKNKSSFKTDGLRTKVNEKNYQQYV